MASNKAISASTNIEANLIHKPGSTKSLKSYFSDDGKYVIVEGYLVSWGSPDDTDLQGEFFSPRTEFCLDWFKERPVLYHHGLDSDAGLRRIGSIKSIETDELGLWVQAQLDMRDRYAQAVYDMVKSSEFGWSSGSVDHLVKIAENGEIAVWPLIEGSITPTPAQPSKTAVRALKHDRDFWRLAATPTTSYRAFKAILQSDDENSDFVRGLEARVRNNVISRTKSSLYIPKRKRRTMARSSSKRLAREFASAFGIRASKQELDSIAAEMEERVDEEVATAAAEELEMEAALASLEEEMIKQEDDDIMARSYRSRGRTRRRGYPVRRYKQQDLESTMTDELALQMDSIASDIADEMAAEMEDELSVQMEEDSYEKAAARALKRRAWRRALRQLEATDNIEAALDGPSTVTGGQGNVGDYLGDEAYANPAPNLTPNKRYRRRSRARRNVAPTPATMNELGGIEEEIRTTEDALLMEAVAERAFRNGYSRGVRKGFRTTDQVAAPEVGVSEYNDEVGNFDLVPVNGADNTTFENVTAANAKRLRRARRGYRPTSRRSRRSVRRSRRNVAPEEAYLTDEALLSDEALPTDGGTYASYRRRRARRNVVPPTMSEEALMMGEDPVASYGYRTDELDEATMSREEAKAFRNGYRNAMRRYKQQVGDEPIMMGEEQESIMSDAYMTGDEEAMLMDETLPARSYGRRRRAKSSYGGYGSGDYRNQADYWKRRAMKAETMEAPSQRKFGAMRVTDQADRPGAYNHAFKSYLYKGLGLMTESEKYVLTGKGRVRWGKTNGTFAAPGSDPRIKTYFGGSDASAGFAVPPDWVAELNKNIMTQTTMAPECRTRTTTSDRIVQPNLITTDARRAHAAEVRWPGEVITDPAAAHRTIEDQYSQVDVPIHVMLMSLTAGNSALEDVSFNLEDEINEAFSEATAIAYDELIWAGDGQGKLQGIVVNDQVVGNRSLNMQTVSGYVPSGSPDGIVTADVLKEMLFHLPRGYRQRAKWYMNSNTGLQIATLKDGEGNYLIDQRDESLQSVGVPDRLLGKPIVYNEYADDVFTNSFPILLADLSRGYIIGKRVDFSIRRFDDSNQAELDQVLFLGRARLGGQVLQPAAIKALKIATS